MCLNPKWVYKKGHYKENTYRGNKNDFYEIGTYSKCGSCSICINEKCNNWVIRNYYETKAHKNICFITLTYAENPVILIKKDLQNFLKRLRYYLGNIKIRYWACGEYGTKNFRPHFHIIIYGWNDDKATYLGISGKNKNILKKSEIINKAWGLGRTSYQEFEPHEIPYTTLYSTPQDTFKKAYKMTLKKCKQLEEMAKNSARMADNQRKNLLDELYTIKKEMTEKKVKYMALKEFNTWSTALGWEKFEEEYNKNSNYTFTEYIEDKEFVTPSPWVKKLANMGDINAANEMFKRENEMKTLTLQEEIIKNKNKVFREKKREILEWQTEKTQIEDTL